MTTDAAERVIVALDTGVDEALSIAASLEGRARWMKVGLTLFYRGGADVVRRLTGSGFHVFLDLKLHDIPHQVEGAARAVSSLGARLLTVHATGGAEMISAAVRGSAEGSPDGAGPKVLAVTVLTSLSAGDLSAMGVAGGPEEQVPRLARLAVEAGAHGIVCSPLEASAVRAGIGPDPLLVTPGIRPAGSAAGDQSRITTPGEAFDAGVSHIVVGRPVTAAADPARAFDSILEEVSGWRA